MARRTIEVAGLSHGTLPIPLAVQVGGLLVSGGISGKDPATGHIPASLESEVAQIYRNIVSILGAAGFGASDVAKVTFFVIDRALRDALNPGWIELFPDALDRPARHTLVQDLATGMRLQAEILAFKG